MTRIEWTDRVWNPVTGCTKVSAGCKHCYAEVMAKRTFGRLYPHTVERGFIECRDYQGDMLTGTLRKFTDVMTHPGRLDAPLRWRKPARVFVNSMSDLFHEAVPDAFIDHVFCVMALCPQHTFQVLTKRPRRMVAYLRGAENDLQRWASVAAHVAGSPCASHIEDRPYPLPNVWLGTSVEDQPTADTRIPEVLRTPAAVRFVSYEPALAEVDLGRAKGLPVFRFADKPIESYDGLTGRLIGVHQELAGTWGRHDGGGPWLDWLIVGGESGLKARPCHMEWIKSAVKQCRAAGVPVFVKQLGSYAAKMAKLNDSKGGDPAEWPDDLRVRQFPEDAWS